MAAALLVLAVAGCDLGEPALPGAERCPTSAYAPWQTSAYVLPYPAGRAYVVLQGNCGGFSHGPGTVQAYAYDFRMPIGEAVVAVRAGRVHRIEERYRDGDHDDDHANGVIVDHGDGTFGRYLHFTQDGVRVELDAEVAQGDTLGRSGNTGFSTEPHLHLDVLEEVEDGTFHSLPVTFRNTAPNPRGLLQGAVYRAE